MKQVLTEILSAEELDDAAVTRVLTLARSRLGMDLAWFSSTIDGDQVVEVLDGRTELFGVRQGDRLALDGSYCIRVLAGKLPAVIPDTAANPVTNALGVTRTVGIGAYVAAHLRASSGEYYGTLCCFSSARQPSLDERDATFLQVLADLLADSIDRRLEQRRSAEMVRDRIRSVLDDGGPRMVFQPVVRLCDLETVGYEALARFPGGHGGPEQWFNDADRVGMGCDLELAAVRNALAALPLLPGALWLSVNVSARTLIDTALWSALPSHARARTVLEITEHAPVVEYRVLHHRMRDLRSAGIRFAIDDAGAGYSGMRQLVELRPDIIKMDYHLTHGMNRDPARLAMATALVAFGNATDSVILAEGIETRAELLTAQQLGIGLAQGYFLGRPMSIEDLSCPVGIDDAAPNEVTAVSLPTG
ncbi:sensor domain-containing phosphodiesterase [Nakamurella leprariae]|uniref:EAL domain-containing protein n=1 Tax=Nakamurella leprariae TaxID=2803911 RepID=A0A939BWR1_9ACTN|nr:EAL domain-containing protein [Nakamurella leprariae]MBM9467798.1 EAL domain-containing protein [Nakamurella leprariae]